MIVEFANRFLVPGFGRKRFPLGVVTDVPDELEVVLPKSARIIDPKDYVDPDKSMAEREELLANDLARAATDIDQATLERAGFVGQAEEAKPKAKRSKKKGK